MAFELLGACLAGVFIGRWIDARLDLQRPAFAVFLTILFLFAAFYLIYKQLLKD
ncbi:MAG: AtpZ/AtpI family protein [Saprospiraceae bacterium]|nr:AtpZ/AtpI family protein [Saprospiraceae bacterium]